MIKIGNLSAKPGAKVSGSIEVSRYADASPIRFPVLIACGVEKGPLLHIGACQDGDEVEGVEAVLKFWRELDPKKIRGSVVLVPVINTPGLMWRARRSPIDPVDFDHVFPGKKDGSPCERLAFTYFNEVVARSDYVIECHGGGNFESPENLVICPPKDLPKVYRKGLELAKASGMEIIAVPEETRGFGRLPVPSGKMGIPVLVLVLGGNTARYLYREYFVNKFLGVFRNVMRHLKMVDGEVERLERLEWLPQRPVYVDVAWHSAKGGGLWLPSRKVGQSVRRGEIIGRIVDPFFGVEKEVVRSPYDAMIVAMYAHSIYEASQGIMALGRPTQI